MAAEVIWYAVLALLAWTYLLYPATVFFLRRVRSVKMHGSHTAAGPPLSVSVIIPARNEIRVLPAKVRSVLDSDYNPELMEIIIGSDASTDGTDEAVKLLAASDNRVKYHLSPVRKGKAGMINKLVSMARGDILILTDANVLFLPQTITRLTEGFSDNATGLCDATVIPLGGDRQGVSEQENVYQDFETRLRQAEAVAWGTMTGPYGGCYAVRRKLFPEIPADILVDDLYAGLKVMSQGFSLRNNPSAIVREDTQPVMKEQFRRRVRIATGSFQNLFRFGPFPARSAGASFAFFSHKVLRWFSPLFLVLFFMTTIILSAGSIFYFCLSALQVILIILSALDIMLNERGRRVFYLRYVTHFALMNVALAAGFFRALGGVENGVWEPTKRG